MHCLVWASRRCSIGGELNRVSVLLRACALQYLLHALEAVHPPSSTTSDALLWDQQDGTGDAADVRAAVQPQGVRLPTDHLQRSNEHSQQSPFQPAAWSMVARPGEQWQPGAAFHRCRDRGVCGTCKHAADVE